MNSYLTHVGWYGKQMSMDIDFIVNGDVHLLISSSIYDG